MLRGFPLDNLGGSPLCGVSSILPHRRCCWECYLRHSFCVAVGKHYRELHLYIHLSSEGLSSSGFMTSQHIACELDSAYYIPVRGFPCLEPAACAGLLFLKCSWHSCWCLPGPSFRCSWRAFTSLGRFFGLTLLSNTGSYCLKGLWNRPTTV